MGTPNIFLDKFTASSSPWAHAHTLDTENYRFPDHLIYLCMWPFVQSSSGVSYVTCLSLSLPQSGSHNSHEAGTTNWFKGRKLGSPLVEGVGQVTWILRCHLLYERWKNVSILVDLKDSSRQPLYPGCQCTLYQVYPGYSVHCTSVPWIQCTMYHCILDTVYNVPLYPGYSVQCTSVPWIQCSLYPCTG